MGKWVDSLLTDIFNKKKNNVSVTFKGKAWPSKECEKEKWDNGFEKGVVWIYGNYYIDERGNANTKGSCLADCMKEYSLSSIEACGAAEGIRYGLSQINKKLNK